MVTQSNSPDPVQPGGGAAAPAVDGTLPVSAVEIDFNLDFDPLQTQPGELPVSSAASESIGLRTQPSLRTQSRSRQGPRVLVVSADAEERIYLRARLAIAGLVWLDEATTTTQAISAMSDDAHLLVFINLDSPAIDGMALAKFLLERHPKAKPVATTLEPQQIKSWNPIRNGGPTHLHQQAQAAGFHDVLTKPFKVKDVLQVLGRVTVKGR